MICLIVLNYNDFRTTEKFVNRIKSYSQIENIVVVDNHSTDNSYEELSKLKNKKIEVIRTDGNKGYASGNNSGAYYAIKKYNPKYLIISNPDVTFSNDVVDYLRNYLEIHNEAGVASCKMICTSGIDLPIAWKLPKYKDCLMENLIILRKILGNKLLYNEDELKNNDTYVDVLPGSFFMIKTSVFEKVNGFDSHTFLYYEENILAKKLKDINSKCVLLSGRTYVHNHSVSINKSISSVKKRLDIAFKSRQYYCREYLGCNIFQLLIHKITYEIGLFNYLVASKIMKR